MPAKLKAPAIAEYRLEKLDAAQGIPSDEATKVTIQQATVRQNAQRAHLWGELVTEIKQDNLGERQERQIYKFNYYDLAAEEVYLTLVGCNILSGEQPLFRFRNSQRGPFLDMNKKEFLEAWGMLDDDIAAEIHEKVLLVNPHWIFGSNVEQDSLGE